jgi:carboxymethylenebutenolidase
MGTHISFQRPDGQSVHGYLSTPANAAAGKGPGVVVLQEWWGLNDQIRGVADRYAAAGYTALVPDLYRGKSTVEAAEAEHLMQGLNFGDAAGQDARGAVQYLKARCGKVGITGYCMGGALTLLSMVHVPEVDAGVVWYGYPPLEYIDASKITAPLMAHWGTADVPFPIAGVDNLEAKLREANVAFEFHRYNAEHAFANETQVEGKRIPIARYDPEAAALAWERTLAFFGKHLR